MGRVDGVFEPEEFTLATGTGLIDCVPFAPEAVDQLGSQGFFVFNDQ